jgi:fatty acid desaturase
MRNMPVIDDPVHRVKSLNAFDRFYLKFIRDERDLPFIRLCFQIILLVLPLGVSLYFLEHATLWWVIAAAFVGIQFYLMGPFILMLHNTSHNPFFKREYKLGNRLIPWGLCPFMGQSPDTYFSHHIGMHHAENNMELDYSSTMPYQRDSFVDFMKYFTRFLFIGMFDLAKYFKTSNKPKFWRQAIVGELTFLSACFALSFVSLKATIVVFIFPIVLVRLLMMMGNWAQHAFIDPAQPGNNYLNSITCVNSVYNKRCWNDGYHIGHHLRPHLHWTEMPKDFVANVDKYASNKALVFEKLDYNQIWAKLMFKKYDSLADYVINLNGTYPSKEALVKTMKERTKRFEA